MLRVTLDITTPDILGLCLCGVGERGRGIHKRGWGGGGYGSLFGWGRVVDLFLKKNIFFVFGRLSAILSFYIIIKIIDVV